MMEFTGSLEGSRSPAGPTSTPTEAANPNPCADTGGKLVDELTSANRDLEMEAMEAVNPRPSPDTAENLVEENASANSDTERGHVKLGSATEQINVLEGKLQQAVNEKAKLKVKQIEDSKFWHGLDSNISSTKTFSGQLTETETLQQLTQQENLVLAEEKDSVNSDLEMEHVKLRSATEQISLLEGKLQQAVNENAKLKVKQTEDSKLWQGLDSKLSSTKTLCDQLTETLQQLASQTEQAEEDKKFFEEMLGKNSKNLDEFNRLFCDLSTKLEDAEQKIISARQEILQIKQEKEEMHQSYKERLYSNDTIIKEKDSLIKQLEGSVDENKSRLMCLDSNLHCMEQELKLKDDACISLKENLANSESELQGKIQKLLEDYTLAEHHKQELLQNILKLESDNQELLGQVQSITEEKTHNAESLQGEITKRDQQVNTLENQINQLHCVLGEKEALYRFSVEREKTLEDQKLQVARIQQDNEHKQSTIWAYHKELQHIQSLVETERERVSLIRKEHEVETKSLRMHHEEECQKMKKEHELQKSKESDEIRNKRQIMLMLVLTSTASFVFMLQPFLPVTYGRYIIFLIAGLWGISSIGLPFGLYGTLRCEQNLSRYSSRVVYTLFSISVIYGFYLLAMKIGDTSPSPVAPSPPSLKEGATDMDSDFWWTFSFCTIGFIVLMGNIWSSVMGCLTGADRDP